MLILMLLFFIIDIDVVHGDILVIVVISFLIAAVSIAMIDDVMFVAVIVAIDATASIIVVFSVGIVGVIVFIVVIFCQSCYCYY